jgi:cell division protein FtsA
VVTTDLGHFQRWYYSSYCCNSFGGNVITDDIKEGCSIIEKQAELLKVKFDLLGQEKIKTMKLFLFRD